MRNLLVFACLLGVGTAYDLAGQDLAITNARIIVGNGAIDQFRARLLCEAERLSRWPPAPQTPRK